MHRKNKNRLLLAVPFLALPFLSPSYAQNQQDKTGIWKDKKTHLIWQRCNLGEQWNGQVCQGKAAQLTWDTAVAYVEHLNEKNSEGQTEWRLPALDELMTLRRCSKGWVKETTTQSARPVTINTTIQNQRGMTKLAPIHCQRGSFKPTISRRLFPTAKSAFYWTSSETNENLMVLGVDFQNGIAMSSSKALPSYVRLVRNAK